MGHYGGDKSDLQLMKFVELNIINIIFYSVYSVFNKWSLTSSILIYAFLTENRRVSIGEGI